MLSGLNVLLTVPDESAGTRIRLSEMAGVLSEGKYLTAFLVVFFITSGVYSFYSFIAPIIRDTYAGGTHAISAALAVLGYSTQEVQMALKGVDVENLPLEEIIRQSLKKMVK